jgi:16S rRNA (cytidine1402-2'-O)-methyltransferase
MSRSMSAGTLSVVATPIGNLEDITLRALRVLREADVIAAEDTRRTGRLLAHHAIATPTVSFHEHNARTRIPQLVARLRAGERIALVTDAGTPGVSDPGSDLVRACIDAGIPVDPIPGANAPFTAAVASGFPLDAIAFFGFPPIRGIARTTWFQRCAGFENTLVFFEAPHRIQRTLAEVTPYLGTRQIVVGRELTKVHQEFLRGTAEEVAGRIGEPRGEYTVVVGPVDKIPVPNELPVSDSELASEFWDTTENIGLDRRAAIAALARKYARPAREVYAALERAKKPAV